MAELRIDLSESEWRAMADMAENEADGVGLEELAHVWLRDKLGNLPLIYEGDIDAPSDHPRERLRVRFRPDDVEVLFVGESAPDGGTFFYEADSNLYGAIREACQRAYGPLPEGEAFLEWFKGQSLWLYDLSVRPVNRARGRPRKDAVDEGMLPLARLLRQLGPDYVVAIKESIAPTVRRAADLARLPQTRVRVLPFPLYQWRRRFVDELAAFLGAEGVTVGDGGPTTGSHPPEERPRADDRDGRELTLHEAIVLVLRAHRGEMSSREIANAVAARDLYTRRDGKPPPASQVAARVRKYPHLFEATPTGIRLRGKENLDLKRSGGGRW